MIIPLKYTTGKDLSIAIETTPRNREREPEYAPRDFYTRNPVTFTPGYQNRHKVEGSHQS